LQKKYNDEVAFRQRMVNYAQTHSVTETAIRYKCSRKTVYKWKKRWDGTKESLQEHSRRPNRTRRKYSEDELRKIKKRLKQCRWTDLLYAFQLSKERDGYTGSYGAFKAIARKL
jgi:transposase